MAEQKKRVNIMTSCDETLAVYVLVQLASIKENLRGYDVRFYLAHSRLSEAYIELIDNYVKKLPDITFYEAKAANTAFYETVAEGGGGQWPQEAYYTLRVQDFLPDDVDRVLYIDAADVIINGDISPYYFDDFEGNSIIATALKFKTDPITGEAQPYTNEDILEITGSGLFNSGSFVINVEKFRNDGYTEADYLYLAGLLKENAQPDAPAYMGDQGFLGAAFAGDVKFFGYPEYKDPVYMPYNFRTTYWGVYNVKGEPPYAPVVIHYALVPKPHVVRFTENYINTVVDKPDFISNRLVAPISEIACMTAEHFRYCEIWWKYAAMTPIYEEANLRARVTADSWARHFLPICSAYNDYVRGNNVISAPDEH